jgi:hypothetical protein
MPERKIQVTEYKCNRCYYQWISRTLDDKYKNKEIKSFYYRHFPYPNEWTDQMYINSKPKYCPKCKSNLWDEERMDYMEKLLRVRLVGGTGGHYVIKVVLRRCHCWLYLRRILNCNSQVFAVLLYLDRIAFFVDKFLLFSHF